MRHSDELVLSLNSYPYGHEELAVCEDLDQVCYGFMND